MANKFASKIGSVFSGMFGSEKAEPDYEKILEENRKRELELQKSIETMLRDIKSDPNIKLSPEVIKKNHIENRLARMYKVLSTPCISKIDNTDLDAEIKKFVQSLDFALRNNNPNEAEWASLALFKTVEALHVETPDLYAEDPEMEMALYNNKLQYARRYNNIIEQSKRQDERERALKAAEDLYNKRVKELKTRQEMESSILKTPEGRSLREIVKLKEQNTASMTENEKMLYANRQRISDLRDSIKRDHTLVSTLTTELYEILQSVESIRVQLLVEPTVDDPRLQARIVESSKRFNEELEKRLELADMAMTSHDEYTARMEALANHRAIKRMYAKIEQSITQTEEELVNEARDRLYARRDANREAHNAWILEQERLELERQRDLENEQEFQNIQDIHVDEDNDTESETITEYEM